MPENTFRRQRGWISMRIADIKIETYNCRTLYLVDAQTGTRNFDYFAGQYVSLRFDDLGTKPLVRSYTISSSPCQEDFIAITVKAVSDGLISDYLCNNIKKGDLIRVRGPMGRFVYESELAHKHLGLIAAGSGVTPFFSIIREYSHKLGTTAAPNAISLLVSFRSYADVIGAKELKEFAANKGIDIKIALTQESRTGFIDGRISSTTIQEFFADHMKETSFMICGPEGLMSMSKAALKAAGVLDRDIKTEAF